MGLGKILCTAPCRSVSSSILGGTSTVLSLVFPGILVKDDSWNFWLAPYTGHNFQNRFWVWQNDFGFRT